jgi:Immunity protein 53
MIDFTGTGLASRPFTEISEGVDGGGHPQAPRWVHCSVRSETWQGAADETQLFRLVELFLAWAEETGAQASPGSG